MTVLARVVRATPYRSSGETWEVIVDLLAPKVGAARDELMTVTGIATSLIASEAPTNDDKIVVWGGGPRVRISCVYGDDAITGDNTNEAKLAKSPTEGEWSMSLPCPEEDLTWVQGALAKKSTRITARTLGEKLGADTDEVQNAAATSIDKEAFLRP